MDDGTRPDDQSATQQFLQFAEHGSIEGLTAALQHVAPELLRAAQSLSRTRDEALDLVHDTFLAAIQSKHRFEHGRRLTPWLLGILQNLHRLRRRADARRIDPDRLPPKSSEDPVEEVDRRLLKQEIERGISRLPLPYRDVVALHLRDGLPPEEIGRTLGQPGARTRTQLWRGLRMLRDSLPEGLVPLLVAAISLAELRGQLHPSAVENTTDHSIEDASDDAIAKSPAHEHEFAASPRRAGWPRWRVSALAMSLVVLATGAWIEFAYDSNRTSGAGYGIPTTTLAASKQERADAPATERRTAVGTEDAGAKATVRVQLVAKGSGKPLSDLSVRLNAGYRAGTPLIDGWFSNLREARSDADGMVVFTEIPPGRARLIFDDGVVRSEEFPVAPGAVVERTESVPVDQEVTGVVVDDTGQPVAGASIWLSSSEGTRAPGYVAGRSAADGTFLVRAVRPAWSVWATSAIHARSHMFHHLHGGGTSRPELKLGRAPSALAGTVRTKAGLPIAGAIVAAFPAADAPTPAPAFSCTDDRGHFLLSGLQAGPHTIIARGAGSSPSSVRVQAEPETTHEAALVLGDGVTLRGRATAPQSLAGAIVLAAPTPAAVGSARWMLLAAVPVAADGSFQAEHVVPGDLRLELVARGSDIPLWRRDVRAVDGELLALDMAVSATQAAVAGLVVDESGAPVGNVEVRLLPVGFDWISMREQWHAGRTDASGRFSIPAPRHQQFRVVALRSTGYSLAASDPVEAGNEVRLQIPTTRATLCSLSGTVLPRGAVSRVIVWNSTFAQSRELVLDADSRFAIDDLPPGPYCVAAIPDQALWYSRLASVELNRGEARDLGPLLLAPEGSVHLTMTRSDNGAPVRMERITVKLRHEHIGVASLTDVEGSATMTLAPDTYDLEIEGPDYLPVRRTITIAPAQQLELAIAAVPAHPYSLTFVLPAMEARSRLWLQITAPDGSRLIDRPERAPEEYEYHVDLGLPSGALSVRAVTAYGISASTTIDVPAGPSDGRVVTVRVPFQ